ncbi:MAG TPA: ADOP family duplicated permease [Vicinamibacterales bacterium]
MDFRYALRQLKRHPRFTAAAVLTLALGIGATTAVYAVVDAVYLKPLSFDHPERIVTIRVRTPKRGSWGVGAGTMMAVKQLPAVEHVAATLGSEHTLTGGALPEAVRGEAVTAEYFAVFGVPAAIGRTFAPEDESGVAPVVISDSLWRRAFGGELDVIGRAVHLSGEVHTIVGVMPRSFPSLEGSEFWTLLPVRSGDLSQMGRGPFDAVARLKHGDIAAARRQAASLSGSLGRIDGEPAEVTLAPLAEAWRSVSPSTWLTLLGAVSLVLLIACANVASLLLARGRARATELTVRRALGATRIRLMRQLLTESLVLAALAAGVGVALAWMLIRALFAVALPEVTRLADTTIDWRVIAFAGTTAGMSALLCGMIPAVTAVWRPGRLVETGRSATRQGRRLSQVLVGLEIALTLALLIGAAMMMARLAALVNIEVGFDPADVHVATLRPAGIGYANTSRFYDDALAELRNGGLEAAAISRMPLHRLIPSPVEIETDAGAVMAPRKRIVSAGALGLLGVPIVRGRDIGTMDSAGGERVALINSALSKQLSLAGEPLGSTVTLRTDGKSQRVRIIGIVTDFRDSYFRTPRPEIYVSASQFPSFSMHLVVRSEAPAHQVEAMLRRAVQQVDPRQAVSEVTTAEALRAAQTAYSRFMTMLVSVFGGLAVLLAISGVGSVVAASISERTREIGIRMSLGAARRHLTVLLVRDVAPAVVVGAMLGLVASRNLSHLLQSLMTGVRTFDPLIYGLTTFMLFVVAGIAVWLPLRAAYQIDPAVVLRTE